mgnify:CR=1 FL=1
MHSLLFALLLLAAPDAGGPSGDPRNLRNGLRIPDEGYCDQPYVVVTRGGNWLCTMTTGPGHEGQRGQHVVATLSTDQGRTWSPLVAIEPSDGPEASWAVPLAADNGRVYVFYTYNGDRVRAMPGSDKPVRADMLGWYCYKYSDDEGRTWSPERYRLPIRRTARDLRNQWGGEVIVFWGICKPQTIDGSVLFTFTKLGRHLLEDGEGWLFRSDNLLTESDPARIRWEMLPEGEQGIRAEPYGSVQEEHNLVALDANRLYCVYRTTQGFPCQATSGDGGRSWSTPEPMAYAPGGRTFKHPRACPRLWKTANGKYLFWFHNHGGKGFEGRNPAWLSGGIARDGTIHWSEPEIALYDPDPSVRISYPDLIEQDGRYWITETQKTEARVHEIDRRLIEGLWQQGQCREVASEGLAAEYPRGEQPGDELPMPRLPSLSGDGGVSLDFWLFVGKDRAEESPGELFSSRDDKGRGLRLRWIDGGAVELELGDGARQVRWASDAGQLGPGRHHVVAIVDGGPKLILFVVDGKLCDGGTLRPSGWTRFPAELVDVNGAAQARLRGARNGATGVERLRVYTRALRTSEAVAHYHAGRSDRGDMAPASPVSRDQWDQPGGEAPAEPESPAGAGDGGSAGGSVAASF